MTRIIRAHGIGGPEVLKLDDIDMGAPGRGEVAIRVKAIGLNRAETFLRRGLYGMRSADSISPIGSEAAGIVDEVGPDVQGLAPGDAVTTFPGAAPLPFGAYAERIIVPRQAVVPQPANLSAIEAAALWGAYLTSYAPMVEIAKVGPGDVVLVTAPSSSVGLAAINYVRLLGGMPVALTRTRAKAERLEALGAAHVIVTDEENITDRVREITNGVGARVAFDPVAGPIVEQLAQSLTMEGILINYGGLSQQPTVLPSNMMMRNLTITSYNVDVGLKPAGRRERAYRFITENIASGPIKPVVDRTFPLGAAAAAHAALEENLHVGKLVLVTA